MPSNSEPDRFGRGWPTVSTASRWMCGSTSGGVTNRPPSVDRLPRITYCRNKNAVAHADVGQPGGSTHLRIAQQQIKHAPKLRYGHTSVPCIVTDLPPSSLATMPSSTKPLPSVSSDLFRKPESNWVLSGPWKPNSLAEISPGRAGLPGEACVERGRGRRPAPHAENLGQRTAVRPGEGDGARPACAGRSTRSRSTRRRSTRCRRTRRRCTRRRAGALAAAAGVLAAVDVAAVDAVDLL